MCDKNNHFFSLEQLLEILKRANQEPRVLGIDFNQWEPHVQSTVQILNTMSKSGIECYYDRKKFGYFPKFGKPYFGKKTFARLERFKFNNPILGNQSEQLFVKDLISSEASEFMRKQLTTVSNRKELAALRYGDFEYGYALLSTLASTFSRSELSDCIINKFGQLLLDEYILTVNEVYRKLLLNDITHIIIFNGRFVYESAAISAATAAKITIIYHEASKAGKFFISCFSPLSPSGYEELARTLTDRVNTSDIQKEARVWFSNRMSGKDIDSASFQKTWAPLKITNVENSQERKRVVIFTTSDDEFLGISSEWNLPNFYSQIEWLAQIADIALLQGHEVIIRLHPNLKSKSRVLQREWNDLGKVRDLVLIKPRASVNSYNLIRDSDLIITCGSTIAMEAGFLGVPVLSVGTGIYDSLNAVLKSQDLKQISRILEASNFDYLIPDVEKINVYGFVEMRKFQATDVSLPFQDSEIKFFRPSILNRIISKVYRDLMFRSSLLIK
jgi:hypothetical protein